MVLTGVPAKVGCFAARMGTPPEAFLSAAQEWRQKPEVWTAWFLPAKSRPANYIDFLACF